MADVHKVCLLDSKLRKHLIDANVSTSIADIKAAAASMSLVPPGFALRLVYQKRILSDDETLGSIGYSPCSFMSLICSRPPLASAHAAPADAIRPSPMMPSMLPTHVTFASASKLTSDAGAPLLQLPSDQPLTVASPAHSDPAISANGDSAAPDALGSAVIDGKSVTDLIGGQAPALAASSREQHRAAGLVQQEHSLSASFQEGCRVSVAGLVSAPQHNGKTGIVHNSLDAHTGRLHVLLDDGQTLKVKPANLVASSAPPLQRASSAAPTSLFDDFPMDGLPPTFLRDFLDANGGEEAFQGLTTSQVKRQFIVPQTQASALSLCAQLRQQRDNRVQRATWFVSHPWQIQFLDLVRALESFFADKPGAIIWLDLVSVSQHVTFDRPPEWWQQTFCSAIGRMGRLVMVMTPWDSPICLTRAWCLIELYACRSSGGDFNVALPPSERARFLKEIAARSSAFYEMLSKVNTAKSECSRDTDKQRIFAAVGRLDGGFIGLDRGVLKTFTEWLEKQLEQDIAAAVAEGQAVVECNMIHSLGILLKDKGEFDRALMLIEKCVVKRRRILGDEHPDTLEALNNAAGTLNNMGKYDRALPTYLDCLAKRKRILGELHTDTLVSLNRLAQLYYNQKDYSRAQALHEECLAKRKLALGEDHVDTIASVNNLAGVLHLKGQHSLAAPLFEECIVKNKRILGDDHPRTIASQTNHANCLSGMGQHERAVSILKCALANCRRILGDEHTSTVTIIGSLSAAYRKQGDMTSAAALHAAFEMSKIKLAGSGRLFGGK